MLLVDLDAHKTVRLAYKLYPFAPALSVLLSWANTVGLQLFMLNSKITLCCEARREWSLHIKC